MGHVIEYRGPAVRGLSHGRPDDGVQHVHRSRRPGRHGGPRRRHVRLPGGPPAQPLGPGVGSRPGRLALAWHRRGGQLRPRRSPSTPPRSPRTSRGGPTRPKSGPHRGRRSRSGPVRRPRREGGRRTRPRVHGSRPPAPRYATSASTRSSSGRAPTAASRTSAPPRACWKAGGSPPRCEPWWSRARDRSRPRPKPRAWTRCLPRRIRVAQPGLLDVPGDEPGQAGARRALGIHVQPQLRRPTGRGGRTHLVSPAVAAATAVAGHLAAPADLDKGDS
jgi:hypothetical protein